ncbi:MAG TPA: ABC transporter permease subunit [Candidatus Latescibacteria bacterium]|jgi:ABC-type transport system involved in multi-copper enzyme maturation permease subunit|nr:ABC transporter permease subunit [Candidatus Latescibacterota bacterium]
MRALLWKEFRENIYKVATGLGVVLLLHILRQFEVFNRSFDNDINGWAPVIAGLSAGVLGMDAFAGERSRGTLEFLLVRPVSGARIVASKFIVGAVGLFVIVAAFWVVAYATPFALNLSPYGARSAVQTIAEVPWLAMVYAWFLPALVVYAVVFVASAATENSAEAAGAGCIIAVVALIFLVLVVQLYPGFLYQRTAILDLVSVVFSREGDLFRIATRGDEILRRTALAGGLVGAGLVAAWLLIGRFREITFDRRQLVVSGFILVTLAMTVPRLMPDDSERILPIGSLHVGDRVRDLALIGERAFLLCDDSLSVIDVSDPAAPRNVHTVSVDPQWSLSRMTPVGSYLCAGGWHEGIPADSAGVVCFDVTGPDIPGVSGSALLVPDYYRGESDYGFEMGRQRIDVEAVNGTLLIPNVTETQSELISVGVDEEGQPGVRDVIVLERYEYPEEVSDENRRYIRADFVQRHRFEIVPGETQVYLGLRSGFSIVDVDADGNLRELSRTDLGDVQYAGYGSRSIVGRGDQVFVRRLWPAEIFEYDVKDPVQPRHTRTHYRRSLETWPRQAGFIYRARSRNVRLYDPKDPYHRPIPTLELTLDYSRSGVRVHPVLRDGYGYAVIDDELAVFQLPPLR